MFDPTLAYGGLYQTSGTLSASAPGTNILFDTVSYPVTVFNVFFDIGGFSYSVDKTAINIFWTEDTTSVTRTFRYADYTSVGAVKEAIDAIPGLDVTGNSAYDSSDSESFKLASGSIPPTVSIYPALRESYLTYRTISDQLLTDRTDFVNDRSSEITDRIDYLINTREDQIRSHVEDEEFLNASDCGFGDLYIWANNRFNRRQGCYVKLEQIKKLIQANQSALEINKIIVS